ILESIEKEAPDVLALQELHHEQADVLRRRFAQRYPYFELDPELDGPGGIGIMSKLPLRDFEPFRLSNAGNFSQRATLEIGGRRVELYNIHLTAPRLRWRGGARLPLKFPTGYDDDARAVEVEALVRRLGAAPRPLLVFGDFNAPDQSPMYLRLSERLVDSHRAVGWGFGNTFPTSMRLGAADVPFPILRLDYVFHSSDIQTAGVHLGAGAGSDHLSLIADLALPRR
ncbi:MAG: endonuclease/exonuclease/phosphatase family protein, partial [Chloroflexi bacterium]|nr:endonuclease/exonuclease/phosphatase family protein [Chloroflexota bacterium]